MKNCAAGLPHDAAGPSLAELRDRYGEVDPATANLLDRCLSADASQRPTADELLHAIKTP